MHVVNVVSPSYTGTTWLNLVLGSHPRCFAIGPPERVWASRGSDWKDACRVHAEACTFWPDFARRFDADRNFYLQLSEATGRDVFVINNPSPAHRDSELGHSDVIVHEVRLVRDGRALAASYARHHEVDFLDAVRQYAKPVLESFEVDFQREDVPTLRYEDVMQQPEEALVAISRAVGIEWSPEALDYFAFEHHITSGNHATIAGVRQLQGGGVGQFRDQSFYEEQVDRMRTAGARAFKDERWQQELGPRERYFFDALCGEANRNWGYPEDRFSAREVREFAEELAGDLGSPAVRARAWARETRGRVEPRLRLLALQFRSRRRLVAAVGAALLGTLTFVLGWLVGSLSG